VPALALPALADLGPGQAARHVLHDERLQGERGRRRCDGRPLRHRTDRWRELGFLDVGGIKVANAFGWVETDSTQLKALIDAGVDLVGPENDRYILEACRAPPSWSADGATRAHELLGRGPKLLELMRANGIRPHALKVNANGSPQHPLYIGYDVLPVPLGALTTRK
jgi:hypothetical protein